MSTASLPAIHPGTPGYAWVSIEADLRIVRDTGKAILVERFNEPRQQQWMPRAAVKFVRDGTRYGTPTQLQVRPWLYLKVYTNL